MLALCPRVILSCGILSLVTFVVAFLSVLFMLGLINRFGSAHFCTISHKISELIFSCLTSNLTSDILLAGPAPQSRRLELQ